MDKILSSEITPESVYLSRRRFIKNAAILTAAAAALAACKGNVPAATSTPTASPPASPLTPTGASTSTDELGNPLSTYEDVTGYTNYYEFSSSKTGVAAAAKNFVTSPWSVSVSGLVNNPKTYDIDDIKQRFTPVDHILRLRCVEGWSMVIPWVGFSLSQLLNEVQPTSDAKYIKFTAYNNPEQEPGADDPYFPWPYTEGLRLDEAMNDLTLLATGLYGKELLPQNGAPIRLVVPWKYGFKSIKSIISIELMSEMPSTFWSTIAPNEYGFYANVNPDVPHPRWSQATESRFGENGRQSTLLFNGYDDQVLSLYQGLDLKQNY
jgi:methionine sulfoxide reductase catalytic subunit